MYTRQELVEMLDNIREAFYGDDLVDRDVADNLAAKLQMQARLRTTADKATFLVNLAKQITDHLHDTSPYVQQLSRFIDFLNGEMDPDEQMTLEDLSIIFDEFDEEEEGDTLMLRMFLQQALQNVAPSSEVTYDGILTLLSTYEDIAAVAVA